MDPAECSLKRVLSLLATEWVYGFMFPPKPPVEQLHYAIVAEHLQTVPLTANLQVRTAESGSPLSDLALDEEVGIYFLPSFSTGTVSVSFQVFERKRSNSSIHTGPATYCTRTVRDDANGIFLNIAEPVNGFTEISYGALISPAVREHAVLVFHTEAFEKTMQSIAHGYDSAAMRKALIYVFFTVETRQCPACESMNPSDCRCKLAFKKKVHPMDYKTELTNVKKYCGAYGGLASVGTYLNGSANFFGTYSSKSETNLTNDRAMRIRLAQWAMGEAQTRLPINLERLRLPGNTIAGSSPLLEYPQNGKDQETLSMTDGVCSAFDGPDLFADYLGHNDNEATTSDPFYMSSLSLDSMVLPPLFWKNDEAKQRSNSICPKVQNLVEHCLTRYLPVSITRSAVTTVAIAGQPPYKLQAPQNPLPARNAQRTKSQQVMHCQLQPQQASQRSQISQRKTMGVSRASGATSRSEYDSQAWLQKLDAAQRKLEIKKLRNRESAHRCNVKKKLKLEQMEADINAQTRQETLLRARENQLREENLRLRKELGREKTKKDMMEEQTS